jgi:hypothetical protein
VWVVDVAKIPSRYTRETTEYNIRSVYRNLGNDTKLMTLPQDGTPLHISMIEYFTRFRDDILQHAKPTCFEELTVFHLLSYMGKKGYENGIGVISAKERTAARENGYVNGIGVMSAEERTAAGKKGYENGIGVMSAEERMAAGKKGYENRFAKGDKWEEHYAVFKVYDGMPERGSALYKWQKNQLARFDARIEKEIAANDGRRTKLEDCITRKKSA